MAGGARGKSTAALDAGPQSLCGNDKSGIRRRRTVLNSLALCRG